MSLLCVRSGSIMRQGERISEQLRRNFVALISPVVAVTSLESPVPDSADALELLRDLD